MKSSKQVANKAKEYKLAQNELIELYLKVKQIIYDNEDKYNYECIGSGIGENTIDFSIIMPINTVLPDVLIDLFFNKIDAKYKLSCKRILSEQKAKSLFTVTIKD